MRFQLSVLQGTTRVFLDVVSLVYLRSLTSEGATLDRIDEINELLHYHKNALYHSVSNSYMLWMLGDAKITKLRDIEQKFAFQWLQRERILIPMPEVMRNDTADKFSVVYTSWEEDGVKELANCLCVRTFEDDE